MDRAFRISRCLVFIGAILYAAQNVCLHEDVCRNDFCKDTSEHILINGNFSVLPCDDFSEFACGLFFEQQKIPPQLLNHSYPNMVTHMVLRKLRHLLELPPIPADPPLERDAKYIYNACINTEKINSDGYKIFEYFMKLLGGWPMVQNNSEWNKNHRSWDVVHHYFKRLTGIGSLVDLRIYAHNYTENVPMIHLEQPRFLFGIYNPFMTTSQKNYYFNFIKDLALLFIEARGSVVSHRALDNDIMDVLAFRKRLADNMLWGSDARKVYDTYRTYTLEDLQLWYEGNDIYLSEESRINWIKLVLKSFYFDMTPINPSEEVVIRSQKYIFNLMHILGSTPRRTILNHIHLHFVENYIRYAPTAAREKALLLFQRMTGLPGLPETDRWKICITNHPLQHVLGKMYSDVMLSPTTKDAVKAMANSIKIRLRRSIFMAAWIDEPTQKKALQKLNKLQIVSGYPDWYDQPQALEQYYLMQTAVDEALINAMSYDQREFVLETVVLRSNPPRTASHEYPTDRTVVYLVEENVLHINAAMLQWPYFVEALPENINYATLGVMISKEIIHAIDAIGIHFDKDGKSENWWGRSLPLYESKLQCIASIYANTTQRNLHPFDNQIAETLAIRLTVAAYKSKFPYQSQKQPPYLSGLTHYHHMESFFLATSSFLCKNIDPVDKGTVAETDLYNLLAHRINIPMMLSQEFSRAYGCYTYSAMNPKSKCEVWSDL